MTKSEPLRIAIVGGGMIGVGVTAALVKSQEKGANITINLYEAAARFTEIGAGVQMGVNAVRSLDLMGLGSAITASREEGDFVWAEYRIGEKSHPSPNVKLGQTNNRNPSHGLHRADFLDKVASLIPPSVIHFSHRCTEFVPPSPSGSGCAVLRFANGLTAEADVVFACDGIKSPLRRGMYRRQGKSEALQEPHYSGQVIYRGLVNKSVAEQFLGPLTTKTIWLGKDHHALIYPVRVGELYNWGCVARDKENAKVGDRTGPWAERLPMETVLDELDGFIGPFRSLLKQSKETSMWGMFTIPELDTYIDDRLALLGDAAHAMLPTQGAGAGQGFEDAFFMCSLFTCKAVTETPLSRRPAAIAHALQLYDAHRRPRANSINASSERAADLLHFRSEYGDDIDQIAEVCNQSLRRIWDYDLAGKAAEAIAELDQAAKASSAES